MTPTAEHHALAAINLAIDSLPESEQDAIRAGVALALALPHAVVEVAAVLAHGGGKRGGIGMGRDGQTADDHRRGMLRHSDRLDGGPHDDACAHRDADSGRLTLGHVAGRAMLAIETGAGK